MRMSVPLTGTVLDFDADAAKLDGVGISGHPDDPVQIALNIGNVSWRLVSIDLTTDLAEIEVTPGDSISEPVLDAEGKQKTNKDGELIYKTRKATALEQQGFLDDAENRVAHHTASPKKLVKSADVVKKYTPPPYYK